MSEISVLDAADLGVRTSKHIEDFLVADEFPHGRDEGRRHGFAASPAVAAVAVGMDVFGCRAGVSHVLERV